jgi:hypothetical protein
MYMFNAEEELSGWLTCIQDSYSLCADDVRAAVKSWSTPVTSDEIYKALMLCDDNAANIVVLSLRNLLGLTIVNEGKTYEQVVENASAN